MHQVALLRLGRLGEPLDQLGVLGVDEAAAELRERRLEHLDRKVAAVLVNVLRRGGAVEVAAGRREQLDLARVERERELGQVARAELRALAQVVERVHAAERGQLLLVVNVLDCVVARRCGRRRAEAAEQVHRAGGHVRRRRRRD